MSVAELAQDSIERLAYERRNNLERWGEGSTRSAPASTSRGLTSRPPTARHEPFSMTGQDPFTGIVTLVNGNAAMVPLMKNLVASVQANLDTYFPLWLVPLDMRAVSLLNTSDWGHVDAPKLLLNPTREELEGSNQLSVPSLNATSNLTLPSGSVSLPARFQSLEARYGDSDFNQFARNKWDLAHAVISKGAPALIMDPDIVFLRNPLPYLANLPKCDLYTQTEIGGTWRAWSEEMRFREAGVGLRYHVRGEWPLFYGDLNSGFMLFSPTEATKKLVSVARGYFPMTDRLDMADPITLRPRSRGDQASLTMILASRYRLKGVKNPKLYDESYEEQLREYHDALRRGRCLQLERIGDRESDPSFPYRTWLAGDDDPQVEALMDQLPENISIWPLNSALFPTRPVYEYTDVVSFAAETPYLVHYNWLTGVNTKIKSMKGNCHWYTQEQTSR